MNIGKLIYVLHKIKLLSPQALYKLFSSIINYGVNVMALLQFSAKTYGERIALADERETLTFKELCEQSEELSYSLRDRYKLASGTKAGLMCANHASLVKAVYAVSSTGADLYLLNAEMSESQLKAVLEDNDFDLIIIDEELLPKLASTAYQRAILLSYHDTMPSINRLSASGIDSKKRVSGRSSSGRLVLMTGGTTGKSKKAAHKPSLFRYLNPFHDFLARLKILDYNTAYIATPIFHGYGLAVMLLFCALGKKVVLRRGFHAEKACELIAEHQVQVVTVVPLMLQKMLNEDANALKSLRCIASGGAELNPRLVKETLSRLGNVLYNLYGTSEAGLNMIATPQDLNCFPNTIGKTIKGTRLIVVDEHKKEVGVGQVGQFCVANSWSMRGHISAWIETGDLGYQDESGCFFLCGRTDSMIVSGGENVYPFEVEQVLRTHPRVEDTAVIGVPDELFGQRLKVFVQLRANGDMTEEELKQWLRGRLARHQMPREIVFVKHLPYTPLGKLDKKQLG